MSQADWTPSPVGEREVTFIRQRVMRYQWLSALPAALVIATSFIGALGCLTALFNGPSILLFMATSGLFALSIGLFRKVRRHEDALQRATQEPDLVQRQEFGGVDGWLVDLIVLQGSAPTGVDRGMMWFEGDRLFFSGRRTSFGLSPDQVIGRDRWTLSIPGLRNKLYVPLAQCSKAGRLALSIGTGDSEVFDLRAAIHRWSSLEPRGGGQLPPMQVGPGVPSRRRLLVGAIASSAYWIAVVWLLIGSSSLAAAALLAGFAYAFALVLNGLLPFERWRAWWHLGRVPR